MPYASGRVIHDADAHIMEVPGFLEEHLEAKHRARRDRPGAVPAPRGLPQHTAARPIARSETFDDTQIMLRQELGGAGLVAHSRTARARSTCWASPASSCSPRRCSTTPRCWKAARRRPDLCRGARPYAAHGRVLLGRPPPAADRLRAAGRLRAHGEGRPRGDRAGRQGADDPVALPRRSFAEPYRLRSAVGHRPGSRPADRVPCRRRRQAARRGLLQQRPAAGAGLPWRRRQFQVDRLHGDRLSADEGADRADRRPRARPFPAPEVRRHRAGRLVGAGLDAQHG